MEQITGILVSAHGLAEQLSVWRRDFHMHPELGFAEMRTSARVAKTLADLGCQVRTGVGRTGVIGELGSGSPMVAIRADMDALPIQEANEVPYASRQPGVMHACGHDAHTAMVLGVATLLAREAFPGTVRLLFQPSEEANDAEGLSGAPRMIEDGAMNGVDLVLALHVDVTTAVGNIRVEAGPASGGVDSFFGRVAGKGGHGAAPQYTIDPIFLTAHVIFALNSIISRRLDPFAPAVVSVGSVHGGQAENVIPDHVDLSGTIRYTEPAVQEHVHAEIRRAFEVARTLGGDYDLRIEIGTPPMINHPQAVELIQKVARDLLGEEHVLPLERHLGAEDFGCFGEKAPGAMFVLGARIEDDERVPHNPRFDIDERALPIGAALLAAAALRHLRSGPTA